MNDSPYEPPASTAGTTDTVPTASKYQTTPYQTERMPPGIPYIVGNEAAERFSFYGMKAILTVFMTEYLLGSDGQLATMGDESAKFWVHAFVFAAYFTPLLGALLADCFLGKYKTILWLSILYCFGHLALALDETRLGLGLGLVLIALGTGAIKPCVSAHVGDQFGSQNRHLLEKVFSFFYFAINFGAFASTLLTPLLLEYFGPHIAFGVPGILMAIATFVFWLGRNRFVHIPARGPSQVFGDMFSGPGLRAIVSLLPIYLLVAVFWSLFDQTASAWVLQAKSMDTTLLGINILPSQVQAANPIMVMALVPIFTFGIYPLVGKFIHFTPLRRVAVGMFITVAAFSISALIETDIQNGGTPNISWQILAYLVLTAAEVMVSITCLEFSYTQSPNSLKSIVMSLYLLSVAAGNFITAFVNYFIQNPDGTSKLPGASYYWFFTGLMLAAAILFLIVMVTYRGRTYIQDEEPLAEAMKAEAREEGIQGGTGG